MELDQEQEPREQLLFLICDTASNYDMTSRR